MTIRNKPKKVLNTIEWKCDINGSKKESYINLILFLLLTKSQQNQEKVTEIDWNKKRKVITATRRIINKTQFELETSNDIIVTNNKPSIQTPVWAESKVDNTATQLWYKHQPQYKTLSN